MEITLNNGIKCPPLGLGTWQSKEGDVKTAIREALDAGYRHIDTAYMYGNEADIGEVIDEYIEAKKIKREDLFITTKLPPIHTRPADVEFSLDMSLKNLKMSYVDLYLIHGPIAFQNQGPTVIFPKDGDKVLTDTTELEAVWKAMEELVVKGKAKSIGVSNFNSKQIERICKVAKIFPVTNQVECHAYWPQNELAEFCKKWKIVLTAYAPIGSPGRIKHDYDGPTKDLVLMDDPVVIELSRKYSKTTAQVLIRYLLQREMIVIPKSKSAGRIRENIQVFDFSISKEDIAKLENLTTKARLFTMKVVSDHPEYPFTIPY